jgi:hypothetical protein
MRRHLYHDHLEHLYRPWVLPLPPLHLLLDLLCLCLHRRHRRPYLVHVMSLHWNQLDLLDPLL